MSKNLVLLIESENLESQLWHLGNILFEQKIFDFFSKSEINERIALRKLPNCFFFEPENNYKVEDVSWLENFLKTKHDGEQKIFLIILFAERLGKNVANRFLKKIEEPDSQINFVFLTNNQKNVLDTIISRCNQKYTALEKINTSQSTSLVANFFAFKIDFQNFTGVEEFIKNGELNAQNYKNVFAESIDLLTQEYSNKPSDILEKKIKVLSKGLTINPTADFEHFFRFISISMVFDNE